MAKVFICYRRADSGPYTGRIYDRLVSKLGRKHVFKDVDDIPPGVNFPDYIREQLRQCAAMLVVIGPHWLDARGPDGARRLDDPTDLVHIEITTAYRLGLAVIPILLQGAEMPTSAALPESLRSLALVNAVVVRDDPDFAHDMERVLAGLERAFAARTFAARRIGRRRGVATPGPSEVDTALPTTPASADAASVEQPARTRRSSRLPAIGPQARRPLLVGLAMVLVVTSFGVVLSRTTGPFLAAGNQARPTQTATTTPMTPTATILLSTATPVFSATYLANEPGQACDNGGAEWLDTGQANAGITCLPGGGGTRMAGIQQSQQTCGSTACYLNDVTLLASPQNQFPADAKVALKIANLQGNDTSQAYFAIWVQPHGSNLQVQYTFYISGTGGPWAVTRLENGNLTTLRLEAGAPGGIYTVAFTISGQTVGYTVNGTYYPSSITERAAVTLTEVQLGVTGNGARPQADFSHFEVDPLP